MLGIAAGILGGALVLGIAQTYLQQPSKDGSEAPSKTKQLPEPEKGFKAPADGTFEARLWQSAKKWSKKLK